MRTNVDLIYFDAGGGHRAAATALKLILEEQQRPWNVRLVHLRDILDAIDIFRKVARIDLQEIYNLMLRRDWTFGSGPGLRFMQAVIRLYHKPGVRLLAEHWRRQPADMVVSVVPNFNRALYEAYQQVSPGRPYVTILTDLADCPPHFWIEHQRQTWICGTPHAEEQARQLGHPEGSVHRVSGMILHPRFYGVTPPDRAAERARLGLDPRRPTGLVLFGGYGSNKMLEIVRRLDRSSHDVQLILICGRNEALRAKLNALPGRIQKHVEGFTTEVPHFMSLADFFIGKPGPGSLSEAIHMGLPVITVRNHLTLPQERYNADWLRENGFGVVMKSFSQIADAVGTLLDGNRLAEFQANTRRQQNRALFEIPPLLESLLTVS